MRISYTSKPSALVQAARKPSSSVSDRKWFSVTTVSVRESRIVVHSKQTPASYASCQSQYSPLEGRYLSAAGSSGTSAVIRLWPLKI